MASSDRIWWPKQSAHSTKSRALSNEKKIGSSGGQSDLPDGHKSDLLDGQTDWTGLGFDLALSSKICVVHIVY